VVHAKKRPTVGKDIGQSPANPAARRVIKKYPNRRLYDTETSTYITLTEVKDLVMKGLAFEVRDAKTGDDLTRSILLQIILEEETAGAPLFTEAALANIIRFYGHAMHGFMGSYLDKNVQAMMDMQSKLSEQPKGMTPEMWSQFLNMQSPMMQGLMSTYLEQSQKAFLQMQDQMHKSTEQMFGAFGIKR
jgi:polyhydroxyalkanoate synthesis repressor PhaR